jgi:hypothetical protein
VYLQQHPWLFVVSHVGKTIGRLSLGCICSIVSGELALSLLQQNGLITCRRYRREDHALTALIAYDFASSLTKNQDHPNIAQKPADRFIIYQHTKHHVIF